MVEAISPPCQRPNASTVVCFKLPGLDGAFGEVKGTLECLEASFGQICFVTESSFEAMEIRSQFVVCRLSDFGDFLRRGDYLQTSVVSITLKEVASTCQYQMTDIDPRWGILTLRS